MTASLTWLALAAAVGVVCLPAPPVARTARLAGRGRLHRDRPGPGARRPPVALVAVAIGAVVLAVAVTAGPTLAVAAAAVSGVAARLGADIVAARRTARQRADLVTALRVLVGELEAGAQAASALASAAAAVDSTSPSVAKPLGAAADAARRGDDAAHVLIGSSDVALRCLGHAWRIGDAGAALAEVVNRVVNDLVAADDQRRTVSVVLAGPRSSAVLLALLPALGIGLGAAMGARPLAFLLGSGAGRALCCAGVVLDAAGVLWTRRIVRRAQPS